MRRILLLLLILVTAALPTLAQNLTAVDLPGGYRIDVPKDFEVTEDGDLITLTDGETSIDVYPPDVLQESVEWDSKTEPADLLGELVTALFEFDDPEINEIDFDNQAFPVWYWEISDDDLKGTSYLIPLSDGSYALLDVYASSTVYDETINLLDEIATSFRLTEEVTSENVECFVSTQDTDTVQMRVGPGENRSVIAFLPAKIEFTVTGSFTEDDGDIWFQLDKAEVDPGSAAAELWVAAEAVDATDGCDAVAAVNAPPIIPASSRPANTGSNSGGNTGGGSTNTTGGSIVNGLWSLYYSPSGNASCAGGQNVSIVTSEFLGYTVQANVLRVAGGVIYSSAEQNDGGVREAEFTVTGPGRYTISYNYGGGVNSQLYLTVVNGQSMVGQEIFNFSVDGTACSGTIGVSASPS